ncbi:MAG: metallophosphoesterase family protein [Candidatus Lernaella stagnicola]|nr:metallophosphoesterase family protein [Candidatus Lernaella stagnicola]
MIKQLFLSILFVLMVVLAVGLVACDDDDDDDNDVTDDDDNNDDNDHNDDNDDNDTVDDDDDDDNDTVDDDDDTVDDDDDDDDDDDTPSIQDCEPYGYGEAPNIIRGPYLQHVTRNSMRIVWETDAPGNSIVRFGPTEDLGYYQCDLEEKTHHEIRVAKLSPDTRYHYVVRSHGAEAEMSTLNTAVEADTPFTFAILGDNRSDPVTYREVVEGIIETAPNFVFNVGDIVADGWQFDHYDAQFFGPAADLMADTPVYVSIGNHESESIYYYHLLSLPGGESFYTFNYGDARFISLNTNRLYVQGSKQYRWFEEQLQRANDDGVEWIFVFSHHPAWSEGWDSPGYRGEILMRMSVVPLMEQYGVDVFFAGHTHDYERGEKNGVVHIITGGGGSALDQQFYDFDHITVYETRYHFIKADIVGKTASFEAMDPDGTVFDTWVMTH